MELEKFVFCTCLVSSIFYLEVDCSFLTSWKWGGLVAFAHSTAANKTHGKARSAMTLMGS